MRIDRGNAEIAELAPKIPTSDTTADPRRAWFVTAIVIAAGVLFLRDVLCQRAARKLQVARVCADLR